MLDLFLCAAAAFYVAYAITLTDGPFDVFYRLRQRLPLGGLTNCFYCLVVWVVPVMWLLLQSAGWLLVWWLAAAGVAAFAYSLRGDG